MNLKSPRSFIVALRSFIWHVSKRSNYWYVLSKQIVHSSLKALTAVETNTLYHFIAHLSLKFAVYFLLLRLYQSNCFDKVMVKHLSDLKSILTRKIRANIDKKWHALFSLSKEAYGFCALAKSATFSAVLGNLTLYGRLSEDSKQKIIFL